jgi:hypothetical protein
MPDPTRCSGSRAARFQRIGDGPFFADADSPRSSSGRAVGAALLAAGLVFSGWVLVLTDQSGVYPPHDGPPPYLAKPDFGDPVTPTFGETLATLAFLKEKFPDWRRLTSRISRRTPCRMSPGCSTL